MKDSSCGFCAPFDVSDDAEIVASPSNGSKIVSVDSMKQAAKGMETILEADEPTDGSILEAEERPDDDQLSTMPELTVETRDEPETESDTFLMTETPSSKVARMKGFEAIEPVEDEDKDAQEKEQTSTDPPTGKELNLELDFDSNPSDLYMKLQGRDWEAAIERALECPEEATHWVSRKEVDGKLRWRLLPIHGAIIFAAPERVIKVLLEVYPASASAADDQGMIPLHLSYRMGSNESVVEELLAAFPGSINVKDGKGRTPLVLAQTTKSPNRGVFIKVLENYTEALAREQEIAAANERASFEAQIDDLRKLHEQEMKTATAVHDSLLREVDRLKSELGASTEAFQQTKARVELLEQRLESKSIGEASVASKMTAMESCLKATTKAKEELENQLSKSNNSLLKENEEWKSKCFGLELEVTDLKSQLADQTKRLESDVCRLEMKLAGKLERYSTLREDHKSTKAYIAILEEQLKKKIAHENSLVEQVSSLARQLSVATQDNDSATSKYTSRLHVIEKEREELRQTVSKLSRKLFKVSEYLESLASEQAAIIQTVQEHQIDLQAVHEEHEKIVASVKAQRELFEQCRVERERIAQLLRLEHKALQQTDESRAEVFAAVEKHAIKIKNSTQTRDDIIRNAMGMKKQLQSILDSVHVYLPMTNEKDEDYVDKVLQTVLLVSDSADDEQSDEQNSDASTIDADESDEKTMDEAEAEEGPNKNKFSFYLPSEETQEIEDVLHHFG